MTFTIIETTKPTTSGTLNHNGGRWVTGRIDDYIYEAKVYPCGSEYGIHEGNISKLCIRHQATREEVVAYDREWDLLPADEFITAMVDALVEHYHAE